MIERPSAVQLSRLTGRLIELVFEDGHHVLAEIVAVDVDEPAEFIYHVVDVISRGPPRFARVRRGTAAAASPNELAAVIVPDP